MSDTFVLRGYYQTEPSLYSSKSNDFSVQAELEETLSVGKVHATSVALDADPAESVGFGDVASAHVVVIRTSGKVTARLTSADGTTQAVPVNGLMILVTKTTPITAITLQRVASTATIAKVLLCESA